MQVHILFQNDGQLRWRQSGGYFFSALTPPVGGGCARIAQVAMAPMEGLDLNSLRLEVFHCMYRCTSMV